MFLRSRLALAVLLLPCCLFGAGEGWAQDDDEPTVRDSSGIDVRDISEILPDGIFAVDRGPLDNFGWGTLEDIYVDLGAGAAVNVFSGNLVVSLVPFVRADALPDSQLGLTYNHLDSDGSPELAPGWSYDLGRFWVPGPWGDRVLLDADGFRDSFFVGAPPTLQEGRSQMDEVVRAWRRQVPLKSRRMAGGERGFREMLGADPLFFGEMSLRLLGAPPPPAPSDEDVVWASSRRGERRMTDDRDDGLVRLTRPGGGVDVFNKEGHLVRVEPASSAPVEIHREGGRISAVEVGGSIRYRIYRDSWERLHRVRSSAGTETQFEYVGRQLFRVLSPEGETKFAYDGQGRLLVMDSPRGVVQIRYDPRSGRVAEARGPEGRVEVADLKGRRLAVSVTVTREGGELIRCSWNARTRVRGVRSATRTSVTQFDRVRPLPILLQQQGREVSFEWDAAGRLVELSEAGETIRIERDAAGRATGLVVPDGSRAVIVQGDSGLLGWRDPEDRSTGVSLGPLGLPKALRRPGGLSETLWRTKAGQLRSVKYTGGESLEFRRDNRGFLRAIESVESGSAGLKIDAGGRLVSYSAPSGLSADLTYRKEGGVESISDGYSEINLDYGPQGRLAGWSGPWSSVKLRRGTAGRVVGFSDDSGAGWTLRRDDEGRPMSFAEGAGRRLDFRWDEAGQILGWERSDATEMVFERDAAGRVRAWDDGISGRVEIRRDRRGRIGELKRGRGLWQLDRDRSGIVKRLVEPSGAATLIQPDGGGRASTLSAPSGLRWRLRHDALGRLAELRAGGEAWTLRRTRAGLPREFSAPGEASSSIRWDRAGRWTALHLGADRQDLTAGYGVLGPTSIGDHRRGYAMDGSLSSWGPSRSGSGWLIDRAPSGQVRGVRWRDPPGSGTRLSDPPSVSLQWNSRGQPVDLGPWALRWQGTRLRSLELSKPGQEPLSWELDRDPQGRIAAIEDSAGHRAAVRRDALGDAASFEVGGQSWQIERDSSGRVEGVQDGAGRAWTYERDAAGRIQRWLRSGDFSLEWFPTDGSAASVTLPLAAGDKVEVTDAPPEGGNPSGGTLLRLRLADGSTALELEEVRKPGGTLDRVEGSWQPELLGATPLAGEPDSATPPNQPADPEQPSLSSEPLDLIGAAIVAAQTDRGIALPWGSSLVHPLGGDSFLPSALGRGVGLSSSGWQRLPGDDGGTVTWLGEGAVSHGMRLPTPSGPWDIPEGWSGFPSPPATVDPPVFAPGGTASAPGSARGSALWWRGLGLRPARLARLPSGVALGVGPGLDPREALQAAAALLPAEAAPTGSGVLLPALPGASRLLPGRRGRSLLSLPELLVLSGDLAPGALAHRSLLSAPPEAWTFEVPGADLLRALVSRRAQPTLPPGWTQGNISGLAAGLDGLSSGVVDFVRTAEPTSVSQGLPAGVRDVLPGECAALPGALGSLPSDGRCSALEDLSDDPLVPGAAVRRVAEDDSTLLFLAAMEGHRSSALGGFLRAEAGPERWSLVTPSGLVLEVDERGRLRSLALQSRQRRGWARSAASLVGRSLLHPNQRELPELGAVLAPEFLPSPSLLPESLWGLIPASPDFPISSLGEPVLRSLRLLAPLSDAPLSPWTLPLGLGL